MKFKSLALAMSAITLSFSSAASLVITSKPDDANPTVSASGGNVPFDRGLTNSGSDALLLRVYDYLIFPDGSIYNRSSASTIGLNAGSSISQTSTYTSVTSEFKYGTYQYVYAAYDKTSGEVTSSSFEFTKEPGANDILQSCKAILDAGASVGDGSYQIDPDNNPATAPIDVYCDMTTDGGGWTLISSYSGQEGKCNYTNGIDCSIEHLNYPSTLHNGRLSDETIYNLLGGNFDAEIRAVSDQYDTVFKRTDGKLVFDDITPGILSQFQCKQVWAQNWVTYVPNPNTKYIKKVTTWTSGTDFVGKGLVDKPCGRAIQFSNQKWSNMQGIDYGYKSVPDDSPGIFYVR